MPRNVTVVRWLHDPPAQPSRERTSNVTPISLEMHWTHWKSRDKKVIFCQSWAGGCHDQEIPVKASGESKWHLRARDMGCFLTNLLISSNAARVSALQRQKQQNFCSSFFHDQWKLCCLLELLVCSTREGPTQFDGPGVHLTGPCPRLPSEMLGRGDTKRTHLDVNNAGSFWCCCTHPTPPPPTVTEMRDGIKIMIFLFNAVPASCTFWKVLFDEQRYVQKRLLTLLWHSPPKKIVIRISPQSLHARRKEGNCSSLQGKLRLLQETFQKNTEKYSFWSVEITLCDLSQ